MENNKPDFFKMAIDRNLYLAAPEAAEMCEIVWNTHVVPLESDNKLLREEIERLKAELKNANSALDNISDMGHA